MSSVIGLTGLRNSGGNRAACSFFFSLLLIAGGCQSDSTSETVDEVRTDAPVADEPVTETNPDAAEEVAPMAADVQPGATAAIEPIADSDEPFCLELTNARDRLLLGEPLTLVVALRNCSVEKAEVRDLLDVEYGLLSVLIGHPQKEQEQVYAPLVRRNGRGKGYVVLDAGEILTAVVSVYFGRDGWQVDTPGTYTFKAEYFVDDIALTSNVITVNIDSPQSEGDLAAAKRLMSADAATYFYFGGGENNGAGQLRALVAEQPDSPWAAYANLGLEIGMASDTNNASMADACRSLEASLDDIVDDWIIALRGYEALSNCLQEGGLESEISRVTEDFLRQHPRAEAILRARQQ